MKKTNRTAKSSVKRSPKLQAVFSGENINQCKVYVDEHGNLYDGDDGQHRISLSESVAIFKRAMTIATGADFCDGFEDWLDLLQSALPTKTPRTIKIELDEDNAKMLNGLDSKFRNKAMNECVRLYHEEKLRKAA